MKFNLIAASLLLGAAFAINVNDVKKMKSPTQLKKTFDDLATQDLVIEAFPKLSAKVTKNLTAGDIVTIITDILNNHPNRLENLDNIPTKHFSDRALVNDLYDLLDHAGKADDFVAMCTPEQFANYTRKRAVGNFHDDLNVEKMNKIVPALRNNASRIGKYAAACTTEFLDHIFGNSNTPMEKALIKKLPKEFLNKITEAPHVDDGEHWTDEQLAAVTKGYRAEGLDFSKVDKKKVESLKLGPKLFNRIHGDLSAEQMSKMSVAQWNDIFANKEGCEHIKEGTKLRDVSSIKFSAKCFAHMKPDVQRFILVNHKNLPEDILSRITKEMSEQWDHKSASGLEILKFLNEPTFIKQLGMHEDITEETHPCAEMDIEQVKEIKVLHENLNVKIIEAMDMSQVDSIKELQKHAEFYVGRDDIFSDIQELAEVRADKKKNKNMPSFWASLDAEFAGKLFGPTYSKLAGEMTKEATVELSAEAKAAMPTHAVAALKNLKDLPKEQIALFSETAFAEISEKHVGAFRLADTSDAQFGYVSTSVQASYFAKETPAELAKSSARFNLLTKTQVAALPAKTFQAIITKETMSKLSPDATKLITAEQLKTVTKEVLATITPEQVAVLGGEIADEKLSGLSVLLVNQESLNAGAREALNVRVPGSNAVRASVSAALIAAVAAVAFLA